VTIRLRKGEAADAAAVGDICYRHTRLVRAGYHNRSLALYISEHSGNPVFPSMI
jgi:hypothetical protein